MKGKRLILVMAVFLATSVLPAGAVMAAPPSNDDFAGSVVIDPGALPFATSADTSEATNDGADLEAGAACDGPPATDAGVWYSITPAADTNLAVSTAGTDYSAGIIVLTGEPTNFALVTCAPFELVFPAAAGVTYHLMIMDDQVDGGGNGGALQLAVSDAGVELCPGIFAGGPQFDGFNVIIGTDNDDLLVGTDGPDAIIGLDGNDTIRGLGGDDLIAGCAGDDSIHAGHGDDEVTGDALGFFGNPGALGGDDTIDGGPGNDSLLGGPGDDTMRGGSGDDEVIGHQGNDLLKGDQGNDLVFGGLGDDDVAGGDGDDFLTGGWGNDLLSGGNGEDFLNGAPPAFEDFDPEAEDAIDGCDGGNDADVIVNCEIARRA